jgi:hypothetical protein
LTRCDANFRWLPLLFCYIAPAARAYSPRMPLVATALDDIPARPPTVTPNRDSKEEKDTRCR